MINPCAATALRAVHLLLGKREVLAYIMGNSPVMASKSVLVARFGMIQ